MKKVLLVFLCLALFPVTSCKQTSGPLPVATLEDAGEEGKGLLPYDYDLSGYLTLPDPNGIQASFPEEGVCTEEELEEAIFQICLKSATYTPKTGIVELYDKVILDYSVMLEGVELKEETRKDLSLVAGMELEDGALNALAKALAGTVNGGICWVEYTYPASVYYGASAGKTVILKGTVKSVFSPSIPEFNETFVHSLSGFESYTVEEFRAVLREDILREKEKEKRIAVWNAFCQKVNVLGYPEGETASYEADYIKYYEKMAKSLEIGFEEFLSDYMELTSEQFREDAKLYAREMVKNDMIFTHLSRTLGITLSDEEFRAGAERYYETEQEKFNSVTAMIEFYTEEQIRENLIRDKALDYLVKHAVRIG